jgi:hypothetical protein
MKIKIAGGNYLKTQPSTLFEDLPWDAYVLNRRGKLLYWADGNTEIEALHSVIEKAGLGRLDETTDC